MAADYILEIQNEEWRELMEKIIQPLITNGMNRRDALHLVDEMENDPFGSDPDMEDYFDTTINDRIEKYSQPAVKGRCKKEAPHIFHSTPLSAVCPLIQRVHITPSKPVPSDVSEVVTEVMKWPNPSAKSFFIRIDD